ncbi:MAG TPA: HYExAFE family protein [Phycisphaerae bacterium]|nr:HYExAFE family protein [Phycisphaerae bacterium]
MFSQTMTVQVIPHNTDQPSLYFVPLVGGKEDRSRKFAIPLDVDGATALKLLKELASNILRRAVISANDVLQVIKQKAFEKILRNWGIPFVAVDEAKRAIFHNAEIGTFDYLVYRQDGNNLLVSIRDNPSAVTAQDADELAEWEKVFGKGFEGVFIFDESGVYRWLSLADWRRGVRLSRRFDQLLNPMNYPMPQPQNVGESRCVAVPKDDAAGSRSERKQR